MVMNEYTKIKKEAVRHTLSETMNLHSPYNNLDEGAINDGQVHVDMNTLAQDFDNHNHIIASLEKKEEVLGRVPMYDRVIYKLHEKGVSCRKIAAFTTINRNEINATVNRVKEYIAANVKYERTSN